MIIDFIKKSEKQAEIFETTFPKEKVEYSLFSEEMKNILNFDFKDLTNIQNVIEYLHRLTDTYDNVKKAVLEYKKEVNNLDNEPDDVLVSKEISLLYLNNSGVYDKKTNYHYGTNDALYESNNKIGCSSALTFALYIASLSLNKCEDEKNCFLIRSSAEQLLYTVANTFHPSIVTNFIRLAINNSYDTSAEDTTNNILKNIFKERYDIVIKSIFETLVIREGKFLAYNIGYTPGLNIRDKCSISCDDLVFNVLGSYIIKSWKELLDDPNQNNWFNTILGNPVYDRFKKQLFTSVLCDITVFNPNGETNVIDTCRYLREKVTEWIKLPDLSKRPEIPEPFNYIDITQYMEQLYSYSRYHVGDVEEIVNGFDSRIELLEKQIADTKDSTEEDIETSKKNLENLKSRKKHYLTLKSLIGFLFLEILSNEKLCDKVFDMDFVLNIMKNEPGIDNAMHDTHSALMSLYSKRDFRPMGIDSINPFFIHKGEGHDVASSEAKCLAKLLSGMTHYNMSSRVAASSVFTFKEFGNAINSIGTSFAMAVSYFSKEIKKNIEYFKNHLMPDGKIDKELLYGVSEKVEKCVERLGEIITDEEVKDIDSLIDDISSKIAENKNKEETGVEISFIEHYLIIIKQNISDYKDAIGSVENIFIVFNKILKNFTSPQAISTFEQDEHNGKKQYCLWPRPIQHEYPIVKEKKVSKSIEETHHENFMDLEPGDITSGYYKDPNPRSKSRYTTTKVC